MLLHASSDASAGFFGPMFSGTDAVMARIWLAVAFVAMAILLRVFAGSELGRKPAAAPERMAADQPLAVN